MSKNIEWNAETLFSKALWLRLGVMDAEAIAGVTYDHPEGITTLEKMNEFKEQVQFLLEQYYRTVSEDVAKLEEVVTQMVELDRSILDRVDTAPFEELMERIV